jgi:hypothetical protein
MGLGCDLNWYQTRGLEFKSQYYQKLKKIVKNKTNKKPQSWQILALKFPEKGNL